MRSPREAKVSRRSPLVPYRTVLIESGVAAGAIVVACRLAWPADLGVTQQVFHPAWIPILLLAARYGPRGLFSSIAIVGGALMGIAFLLIGNEEFLYERFHERTDLWPLLSATALSWVGMSHESRYVRTCRSLDHSLTAHERTTEWANALQNSLGYLRSRCDRIDSSINLWRRVAGRLERGTAREAADAALELCKIRLGATRGCVEQLQDGNRSILARHGYGSVEIGGLRDLSPDETVQSAVRSGQRQTAFDLPHASESDSDVAIPVVDDREDETVGVIALGGVDPARLCAAELQDLVVIADWLSSAIALPQGPRAVREERAG